MIAIFKKEINQFFSSITGYIAIILFLVANALFLFVFPDSSILDYGYASLEKLFDLAPWIFLLLIPAVTMRTLSEEFKSGTMELLATKPVSGWQIITGKYLACLLLILFALIPTLVYYYTVCQLSAAGGAPDNGGITGSYIGLFLLGAVFTAIGVWASSLTNNAVVAFLAAVFTCFVFYNGFDAASKLPGLEGGADYYLQMIGISYHYDSISRGVVDSRDIIYFGSVIILFLTLARLSLNRSDRTASRRKHIVPLLPVILILLLVNVLAFYAHFRLDLTAEKRFTLSPSTKKLLHQLEGPVRIRVFLKGKFPAGFRHLATATRDLLEEFREYGGKNIRVEFVNPLAGLSDTMQLKVKDSLAAMGIVPYNVKATQDITQGVSMQLVFPAALADYKGKEIPVQLLEGQPGLNPLETLNHSAALLEYKFADAIYKLQEKEPPVVGYMLGNGEPLDPTVYAALTALQSNYRLDTLNLAVQPDISQSFDAVVFLKPHNRFDENEKMKIDQYIMHGGKVLWLLDELNASMDSLQSHTSFIAMDLGLNLDDLLFTYGVRINPDLVQDLQCDKIPLTVGYMGNKPQIELVPWTYFPLFAPVSGHPVVKNMDLIRGQFASSMDTVGGGAAKKTILLSSSAYSSTLGAPVKVSLESTKIQPVPRDFRQQFLPVAVLLEGKFPSLFRNRLDKTTLSKIDSAFHQPFKAMSGENKMIVVSDGDIATNAVSQKDGPLPMGMNEYTRDYPYANQEFFLNCLEYLTNSSGIMESRGKEFKLRLLDAGKVKTEKSQWQLINFGVPILFILLFGMGYNYARQRKYAE